MKRVATTAGLNQGPAKDADAAHPIAPSWRPTFVAIVSALVQGDYRLRSCGPNVRLGSPRLADQIRSAIAAYGETLAALPEETWRTSVAQWMEGFWDVLVDLWTVESGACDLVLGVRVHEAGDGYRFVVDLVYVP